MWSCGAGNVRFINLRGSGLRQVAKKSPWESFPEVFLQSERDFSFEGNIY
jgi:hypothetical protein